VLQRFLVVFVFASLLTAACGRSTGHNVIFISIDTLRPDHLGCYGYAPPTTPSLDAFRRDAILFREVTAHAPTTLTSHASMFASLIPTHHGASHLRGRPLSDEVVTLTEVLREDGWQTAAFVGGGQLAGIYGLDQGFDTYDDGGQLFQSTVDSALAWLDQREQRPFYLFLHTYEVHHPYEPRPDLLIEFDDDYDGSLPDRISIDLLRRINNGERKLDVGDAAHIIASYDAEIRSMDEAFGRLIQALKDRDLYDGALIVFTSDHGEEFGEHGTMGWHSHTLYEELLRVPLLVKLPASEQAGATVEARARGIDIAPTVLEAVGLPRPTFFEGASLLPAGDEREAPAISTRVAFRKEYSSLVMGRWKWNRPRLFDLAADPGETVDLAEVETEVAEQLERKLRSALSSREAPRVESVAPGEEDRRRLRALGYLE
jgi:arylsulfatase A-like enzyme